MILYENQTVTYLDVNNVIRKLIWIEQLDGVVKWRRGYPYSLASRYETEDGYIIQIPDHAWLLVDILEVE